MVRKPPKALQDEWDRILKASGFEDIEDRNSPNEMLKTWHSSHFARRYNPETFEAKKVYFDDATEFLNTYKFKTRLERTIWELHTEGRSLREIAKETGKVSKDGALKIIKQLLLEMRKK